MGQADSVARRSLLGGVIAAPLAGMFSNPVVAAPNDAEDTFANLTVDPGPLKLANEAQIQWRKPDGGYVQVMRMEKDGTVRLCDDDFFYSGDDTEHLLDRVIEVRNPNSGYPDFRLPITRHKMLDADSKLQVRSMGVVETRDPAEINMFRTGKDGGSENDAVADGAITGIIRWYGRKTAVTDPRSSGGWAKGVELYNRSYGKSMADHYAAFYINIHDSRYPNARPGMLALTKQGMRIGHIDESPGENKVAGMLEVDCIDDRGVVVRRPDAKVGDSIALSFATGKGGAQVTPENQLFEVRSLVTSTKPLKTAIEFRVNSGAGMKTAFSIREDGQVEFSHPIIQPRR